MRKPSQLPRHQLKKSGSILSLILLLASFVIAGSVDAAVSKTVTHSPQSQTIFQEMLKHALNAYQGADFQLAHNRLLPLALQDSVDAQYYLATLYDDGRGVEQNSAMAAFWFRRAAKQGHINAQYNIGVAHAHGEGVRQSMVDAVRWWRVAAVSGSIDAQFNLGIVYLKGQGIRHSATEAVHWWGKAAQQGDAAAQYNLGALYANGQGVSKNVDIALNWWSRAAEQGFEQAIVALRSYHSLKQVTAKD